MERCTTESRGPRLRQRLERAAAGAVAALAVAAAGCGMAPLPVVIKAEPGASNCCVSFLWLNHETQAEASAWVDDFQSDFAKQYGEKRALSVNDLNTFVKDKCKRQAVVAAYCDKTQEFNPRKRPAAKAAECTELFKNVPLNESIVKTKEEQALCYMTCVKDPDFKAACGVLVWWPDGGKKLEADIVWPEITRESGKVDSRAGIEVTLKREEPAVKPFELLPETAAKETSSGTGSGK